MIKYYSFGATLAAIGAIGIGSMTVAPTAGADPTVQAESNYCTGTALPPESARVSPATVMGPV